MSATVIQLHTPKTKTPSVPKLHRSGIPDRLKYSAGQSAYEKAYIDGFNCCVTKMENEQLLTQLGILT